MVSFYWAVIAFVTLLFEYINHAYPDPLASYGDIYSSSVRFSMASLIVLAPVAVALMYMIRRTIQKDASKEHVWVRRWAIMLTLFAAGATVAIDLITLLNTFLGGELTVRFLLKVLAILLVALGTFLYFLAELRRYWSAHPRRARASAIAVMVLALITIIAGFFIIGTPNDMRLMRYDEQRIDDLSNIQHQILYYYQQKRELPDSLGDLDDPLSGWTVPEDPEGRTYAYAKTAPLTFELCATFNRPSRDLAGQGAYPAREISVPRTGINESWRHEEGEACFTRTIDPERYPPLPKPVI